MRYIDSFGQFVDTDRVLIHYGVKGMKWKHRKARRPVRSKQAASSSPLDLVGAVVSTYVDYQTGRNRPKRTPKISPKTKVRAQSLYYLAKHNRQAVKTGASMVSQFLKKNRKTKVKQLTPTQRLGVSAVRAVANLFGG